MRRLRLARSYQHYKDRQPPWVKQYRDFWTSYELRRLSKSTRLLASFLPSFEAEFDESPDDNGELGRWFPEDIREIASRAALTPAEVKKGIEELETVSFVIASNGASRSAS